ncbi:dockerin type I domain-containing protein [Ruminococcus sp.]|uniref:dockerin type I domain-containing protein n=1 Tax=Ruminococcus sp. TaxID=41978 RepID=UPI0025FFD50D|nr:dockerin type I domain-containing protein [Ruminococcus sp.]
MKFNKIAAILMASVLTAGVATVMAASAGEYYVKVMKGDIDGNGRITKEDAELVQKFINGERELGNRYTTADVNWDGNVDIEDAVEIINKVNFKGDIDESGVWGEHDCKLILDHINGKKALKGNDLKKADVNSDNKINVIDVAIIKNSYGKAAGYKAGNVLDDNYITSDDTDAILDYINGNNVLDDEEFVRADINCDGKVEIDDYSMLHNYISNK